MFIGWCGLILALVCTGVSSHIIGRPVYWLDDQRWSPFVLVLMALIVTGPALAAAIWSLIDAPWIPLVSGAASIVLAVAAVIDRNSSPGSAVVEGALALAAVLLSSASFAGRYRMVTHS